MADYQNTRMELKLTLWFVNQVDNESQLVAVQRILIPSKNVKVYQDKMFFTTNGKKICIILTSDQKMQRVLVFDSMTLKQEPDFNMDLTSADISSKVQNSDQRFRCHHCDKLHPVL